MLHNLQIAGIAASLLSCTLWVAAALIRIPQISSISLIGPKSLAEVLQKQSRLNALAAACAAVAAACQAATFWPAP